MEKDDLVYVGHMLDTSILAIDKTTGLTRDEFDADENLRLALTHLIQTIGEAARHVSYEFQQQYPDIPWRQLTGMRHRIVHDYLHVDYDIVWEVVTRHLPDLKLQLEPIVPADD